MGANTTMFITTKKENILEIMPKVISALNKWQRNELDNYWNKKGFENRAQYIFRDKENPKNKDLKDYSNGIRKITTHDFRSFSINFNVNDETRNLFITHTCSTDYSEIYEGDKIIFSLGCWGMNKEIMLVIANAIKDFGDIYFVENDCAEDFIKLKF